jgi:Mg-chelatase subunit ChlD
MTRNALIMVCAAPLMTSAMPGDCPPDEQGRDATASVIQQISSERVWIADPEIFLPFNERCRTAEWQPTSIDLVAASVESAQPVVEVVFVLDTTGSMGGLIEGAKQKIWSIANAIVTGEPRPTVRMGLVAYRDVSDAYVTQITGLTDDLDAVYEKLMGFQAQGGGDGPESVNQALNEAVTKIGWSESDDVLRIVYLVGDAPPHMDYEQDVKYAVSCELAAKRGLIVNTIQCGNDTSTTPIWQEIARLAEGEFFQIEQSGGMQAISTPYDEELGELAGRLGQTMVVYGSTREIAEGEMRMRRAERLAEAAPAEAAADRAAYMAKAGAGGAVDLIADIEAGKIKLEDVPESELPEVMREMSVEEREAHVAARIAERAETREQIETLSAKRQAFIKEAIGKAGKADSFDHLVLESLQKQAARVGIDYDANDE